MNALKASRKSYDDALQEAVEIVWQMIGSGVCSIVLVARNFNEIEHVAMTGCSDELSRYLRRRRIGIGLPEDTTLDQNLLRNGRVIEKFHFYLHEIAADFPPILSSF
ncbi:MAG TPA: hypothetical protein VN226_05875 [Anaerolineales bacterium]|nr:hypothetical protein [Anaerolineales bacterium]